MGNEDQYRGLACIEVGNEDQYRGLGYTEVANCLRITHPYDSCKLQHIYEEGLAHQGKLFDTWVMSPSEAFIFFLFCYNFNVQCNFADAT